MWVVSDIMPVVSVVAGGVVCSIPCSPSVPDVSVFLLQPSAKRSAHVNTRTRVTANIFFIPLSPPSGYRIFVILRIPDFMRRQWRIKQNTTGGSGASGKNLCLTSLALISLHRPQAPKRQNTRGHYASRSRGVKEQLMVTLPTGPRGNSRDRGSDPPRLRSPRKS